MKFRKKPVVIEAIQYTGTPDSNREIIDFCLGSKTPALLNDKRLIIATLEGDHTVSVGDFVIKGVQGEFYPCKPDIFAQTYEEVVDPELTHVNPTTNVEGMVCD